MVEEEVDKRIFLTTHAEFRYIEVGGFESRVKGGGERVCVEWGITGFILQDRQELLKNKDWEAGVKFL